MEMKKVAELIEERSYKTTEARRRAVKRYEAYHEFFKVTLPSGTQERILAVSDKKVATFLKEAALEKLERLEQETQQ